MMPRDEPNGLNECARFLPFQIVRPRNDVVRDRSIVGFSAARAPCSPRPRGDSVPAAWPFFVRLTGVQRFADSWRSATGWGYC